ncbi:hypothetical protein ACQ86N_46845 [Puia sp. P3]|uniref:hypothetical protein n=1 Tax=Puia sp. P3 TaxID=3423952 RepID=UPI003D67C64E
MSSSTSPGFSFLRISCAATTDLGNAANLIAGLFQHDLKVVSLYELIFDDEYLFVHFWVLIG